MINGKEAGYGCGAQIGPELYGDHGADLVFEAAGAVFTAQQAVQIVSRGGKIMMVGTQSKPVPIDFSEDQPRSDHSDRIPLLQ